MRTAIIDDKTISPYVYSIWGTNGVRVDLNNGQSNIIHTWLTSSGEKREVLFGNLIINPTNMNFDDFKLEVRKMNGDQMFLTRRIVPITTNDTNTNWKIQGKAHLSAEVCDKLEEWLLTGTKHLNFFGYEFFFNAKIKHGDQPYFYTFMSPQNTNGKHDVIVRQKIPILNVKYMPRDDDEEKGVSFFNPKTVFDLQESKAVGNGCIVEGSTTCCSNPL
jgi:hypothetical protein